MRDRSPLSFVAALLLLLVASIPTLPDLFRTVLTIVGSGALLLLGALLLGGVRVLRHGPTPLVLGLFAWSVVCFFLAPFRSLAAAELLRVGVGVAAYLVAAYGLRGTRDPSVVVVGLLGSASAIALWDLARFGTRGGAASYHNTFVAHDFSQFGTHENIGTLLMLLLPIALAFAASDGIDDKRRLPAQAATLIIAFAWLLARCRSAWLGGAVALVVLAVLMLRFPATTGAGQSRRPFRPDPLRILSSPLFLIVAALIFLAVAGGVTTLLSTRARTVVGLLEDTSWTVRTSVWSATARMVTERPWTGWGLGAFPALQGYWSHHGDDENQVLRTGTGHQNIAHDHYLQWSAETGVIGLTLLVAALVGFLVIAGRSVRGAATPFDRALLCGTIASTCGGMVDALASPGLQFHGITAVFWAIVGLGVSGACRSRTEGIPLTTAAGVGIVAGVLASVGVLALGYGQIAAGNRAPRGELRLIEEQPGRHLPAEIVEWSVHFTDGLGKVCSTAPGTFWQVDAGGQPLAGSFHYRRGKETNDPVASALRVQLPDRPGTIVQVWVRYRDAYGRVYRDSSAVRVSDR